ncbi:hypothetical protein Tco_1207451 [Tanacetum coccineum]
MEEQEKIVKEQANPDSGHAWEEYKSITFMFQDGSPFLLYKNAFEESFLDSLYKSTTSMDPIEHALYLENDREMEVTHSYAVASCRLLTT